MYIDNGVNINAAWTPYIAVSSDGNNWELIPKEGLKVRPRIVNANTASKVASKTHEARITLTGSDRELHVDFDIEDVDNQPTWNGSSWTELNTAVADIGSW